MENEMIEIDVKGILELLWSKAISIIVVTLIFAVISFVFTKTCIPKRYSSSVSLYVMNNKVTQNTGEILSSDISASQMLVNTYAVILSDNLVMEDIGKRLIEKNGVEKVSKAFPITKDSDGTYMIPSKAVSNALSMGSVNDTEVLKVSANTLDPQMSVDVCLAMTEVAPKILSQVMGVAYVNPIGYPELPNYPSSPNTTKNVVFGAFVGFVFSVCFIALKSILDNTITDSEALRKKIDVPVLGEIPFYNFEEVGGTKNV